MQETWRMPSRPLPLPRPLPPEFCCVALVSASEHVPPMLQTQSKHSGPDVLFKLRGDDSPAANENGSNLKCLFILQAEEKPISIAQ